MKTSSLSMPKVYNGGADKRTFAEWRRSIENFNAHQDGIFSRTASNRQRPDQSDQIRMFQRNPYHHWTAHDTAAKQKVEQTKRDWNANNQLSVDHIKLSLGPNIQAGLEDLWFLTSSDQDPDFTFREIFRRVCHEHGPTQQDISKSRRQIMGEIMTIPQAESDRQVQESFNKLTRLILELRQIGADAIPLEEIKEICTTLLGKPEFQQDRTLINSHAHGSPTRLSHIITIWRQCAEQIRSYKGHVAIETKQIAATATTQDHSQDYFSDAEEEACIAAMESRPFQGNQTFDSRSRSSQRPSQTSRFPNNRSFQQRLDSQSKLLTEFQQKDSFQLAEIEFLRQENTKLRRHIERMEQQKQQQSSQQSPRHPTMSQQYPSSLGHPSQLQFVQQQHGQPQFGQPGPYPPRPRQFQNGPNPWKRSAGAISSTDDVPSLDPDEYYLTEGDSQLWGMPKSEK